MMHVRVVNWSNIHEIAKAADIHIDRLTERYNKALAEDDVLMVGWSDGIPLREPFEPPYTEADLPELDFRHWKIGMYDDWMVSEARNRIFRGPELHHYGITTGPKMLREALCLAQSCIRSSGNLSTRQAYSDIIQELINECDRKRPLGSDGKHGNLHTDECGCEDKPGFDDPRKGLPLERRPK